MRKPTASLFPVSKERALEGARRCIKDIEAHRRKLFNNEVDKVLNRLFFRPKTRKAAEKIVRIRGMFPEWDFHAWGTLGRAREIADACKVAAGDIVYLNAEDSALVYENLTEHKMPELNG